LTKLTTNWDLWETFRGGDYRKLSIRTSSGYGANISDLEFINYDRLEIWLLDKTNLELNLDRKLNIEVRQARWNRWLNLFIILMFVFFFGLLSTGNRNGTIDLVIRILMIIIGWRLVIRLLQYQQRINRDNKKDQE
jgi:hypothetical protein